MTKNEYWLLHAVLAYRLPIPLLASENMEQMLNLRVGHGMSRAELTETFYQLFVCGDLDYERNDQVASHVSLSGNVPPTRHDVELMLVHSGQKYYAGCYGYGLTPQGGARWERYAQPDWTRYARFGFVGHTRYIEAPHRPLLHHEQIIALNAALIEQYLQTANPVMPRVLVGEPTWDHVTPWEATYWKTFPHAHRASYWSQSLEERISPQEREQKLRTWQELRTWYLNPFAEGDVSEA